MRAAVIERFGEPGPAEVRAADLVSLLDSLGLAQAVFMGNSSPAEEMTYLAEHDPERVVGLVYLAHAPFVSSIVEAAPSTGTGPTSSRLPSTASSRS